MISLKSFLWGLGIIAGLVLASVFSGYLLFSTPNHPGLLTILMVVSIIFTGLSAAKVLVSIFSKQNFWIFFAVSIMFVVLMLTLCFGLYSLISMGARIF